MFDDTHVRVMPAINPEQWDDGSEWAALGRLLICIGAICAGTFVGLLVAGVLTRSGT